MESAISLKFRLYPTPEQSHAFSELCQRYADACNFASQYAFDNGMITSAIDLNRGIYLNIRQKFNLKAQLAQSVSRTVTARYKTIVTNNIVKYIIRHNSVDKLNYQTESD